MAADLIFWKTQYHLGLDEIDAQHKSLLELINRAWRAIVRRSDQSVVFALIEELEKHTLAHFAAEERFMRATDYPGFDDHHKEHNFFIARIAEERLRSMKTGILSLDLMHFLRDWLIDHIVVLDKAYVDFVQRNKATQETPLSQFFTHFF